MFQVTLAEGSRITHFHAMSGFDGVVFCVAGDQRHCGRCGRFEKGGIRRIGDSVDQKVRLNPVRCLHEKIHQFMHLVLLKIGTEFFPKHHRLVFIQNAGVDAQNKT